MVFFIDSKDSGIFIESVLRGMEVVCVDNEGVGILKILWKKVHAVPSISVSAMPSNLNSIVIFFTINNNNNK